MRKLFIGLITLFGVSTLTAFQNHTIDETAPLTVVLSHTCHNRIAIEEGAVVKIIGDSNLMSVNLEKATGQAFVTLTQPILDTPTTLTVISSGGAAQDLTVFSKEGPGEYILLQEPSYEDEDYESVNFQALSIEFLNTILEGKMPTGYGQTDFEIGDTLNLPSPLKSKAQKALEGPFEKVLVYQITNEGSSPINLSVDALKTPNTSWTFLSNPHLHSNESSLCITAVSKDLHTQEGNHE